MKAMRLFIVLFIFSSLSTKSLAQKKATSLSDIRAIKFTELAGDLNQTYYNVKSNSRNFIERATRNLDKTGDYDRKNGILHFRDRRGVAVQSFDLKSLNIINLGHNKWSPDGKMLLISMRKGESSSLYLLKIDGSMDEVVPCTKKMGGVTQPAWSFDSRMFSYLKIVQTEAHEIWIKSVQGDIELLVEKVPMGEGVCGNPVWFNQNYRIVYIKTQPYMKIKKYVDELWTYDFSKREKKKIYEGRVLTTFPIVSPDDSMVGTNTNPLFTLFDLDGNVIKNLDIGSNVQPQWSPDGQYIAFLSGKVDTVTEILLQRHICIVDIHTGEVKDLTPEQGLSLDAFRWYDDNTIVY